MESLPAESSFTDTLAERLATCDCSQPLVSGFTMPVVRLRRAAVLVALIARANGLHVLLTRRSEALRDHAGQISFPGGCIEPSDASPQAAALREAMEEVGLAPERVEILGAMPPYQTATGFIIHPSVGLVQHPGMLRADPDEVAEIFEVPLAFFLDPRNHQPHVLEHEGRQYRLHAMPYRDYYIWGATAGILRQLYHLLDDEHRTNDSTCRG